MGGYIKGAFNRAKAHISIHTQSLWFPVIGAAVAAAIVWLMGITMTFFSGMPEGLVRSALDVVVCVLIAYILYFTVLFLWFLLKEWLGRRLNPWLLMAAIGALVFVGCIGGYIWDRSRGPILWDWNQRVLLPGWDSDSPIIWIDALSVTGFNRSDDPITIREAYIRSDSTDERVPLIATIQRGTSALQGSYQSNVIPANKEFKLTGDLSARGDDRMGNGRTSTRFSKDFPRMSFFFNGQLVRRFYERDVDELISKIEAEKRASQPH
jgi:hypothetical protein